MKNLTQLSLFSVKIKTLAFMAVLTAVFYAEGNQEIFRKRDILRSNSEVISLTTGASQDYVITKKIYNK